MSYIGDLIWRTNPLLRKLVEKDMLKPRPFESAIDYGTRVHEHYKKRKDGMRNCEACMAPYKEESPPMYQSYKGMPIHVCQYCFKDDEVMKFRFEPIWKQWERDNRMCVSNGGKAAFSHLGIIVDPGTVWYMDNRKLIIDRPELHYHNTNGDVSTKYLSFQFEDDKSWNICTHKMFSGAAKFEEPIVERFVTPDLLMRAEPCEGGVRALCQVLNIRDYGDTYYSNVKALAHSGKLNVQRSVQYFYDSYHRVFAKEPSNTYLLFVAKTLDLVPKNSTGPDRATLKRLLGIK